VLERRAVERPMIVTAVVRGISLPSTRLANRFTQVEA
jgi:hypothetical protein